MTDDLIKRLEAAKGAFVGQENAEVSLCLATALFGPNRSIPQRLLCRAALGDGFDNIGAALALAEEVLGWSGWSLWRTDKDRYACNLSIDDEPSSASTPALAIIIAILKAKEAGQ